MSNVKVSYQELQQKATEFRNHQQTINDELERLKGKVHELTTGGFVTDSASGQFNESYEQLKGGLNKALEGLDGLAGYLEKAATTFQNVDSELAKALKG